MKEIIYFGVRFYSKIFKIIASGSLGNDSPVISAPEVALQRCSYKMVFWKYAANLQEIIHAEA